MILGARETEAAPDLGSPVSAPVSPCLGEWLTRSAAVAAIRPVVTGCSERFHAAATGRPAWVSNSGLLVVAGAEDARIGAGIRSAMNPTRRLLASVAQINQSDPAGHVWLTEDRLLSRWSAVWGLTIPYAWSTAISLQRAMYTCLTTLVDYRDALAAHLTAFGGAPYWSSLVEQCGDVQSAGEVLIEQIG